MKKVLIITYYFPPAGGAGVQRTLKFVKYLREFGWEPVVLTARNADYPAYDRSLFQDLPRGLQVYRAPIFEPYRIYRKFTGRSTNEATDIATLTLDQQSKRKFSERISEWLRASFFIPDARMAWLYPAYFYGRRILREHRIDVLFSSAPPYTTHLIARKLKHAAQLPWIADFRDSWIGWLSAPQWRPGVARAIEKRMEANVLKDADRIITVTHGVREDLLSRHPDIGKDSWIYLPNGYDAADFESVKSVQQEDSYVITYTGSLYGNRNPQTLVTALEKMLQQDPHLQNRLMIRLVGRVGDAIMQHIRASTAAELFQFIPYVSHADSLAYLVASDAALLIIDDAPANRGIVTGKLYEYIGAKRPIIALAPEGEAATLIRDNGLGWVISPHHVEDMIAVIRQLMMQKRDAKKAPPAVVCSQFERRQQTKKLAALFDGLTVAGKKR